MTRREGRSEGASEGTRLIDTREYDKTEGDGCGIHRASDYLGKKTSDDLHFVLINSGPVAGFGRMRHNWPVALDGCLADADAEAFREAAGPG